MRVAFMLLPSGWVAPAGRRLAPVGSLLSNLFPGLQYDLRSSGLDYAPRDYAASSFVSSFIWGLLLSAFSFFALNYRGAENPLPSAFAIGLAIFVAFLLLHLFFPSILSRKAAERTDREITFALRDLLVQVESGVPLYNALNNLAMGDYGSVSNEFAIAVREISTGTPEKLALQRIIARSRSESLARSVWQLDSALSSGSSLAVALRSVVDSLEVQQHAQIRNYSSSLNFLSLLYLLCAAALPALGITFLILLSTFSGMEITDMSLIALGCASILGQAALIGYINASRPQSS